MWQTGVLAGWARLGALLDGASGASSSPSASVKAESELRRRFYLSGSPLRAGPAPQPPVWRRVSELG